MKTALLVIDVQEDFFADKNCPVYLQNELIHNINQLIDEFRKKSLPVIFVQHTEEGGLEENSEGWKIYKLLSNKPSDYYLNKTTPDSFLHTDLLSITEKQNVDRLVICGLQTDYCIDTTCRSAFGKSLEVILASDAHSTYDNAFMPAEKIIDYHNNLIGKWFAEVRTTEDIIDYL